MQFLIWAICNFGGPVSLSIVFQSGMQKLTIGIEKLANWKLLKVKSMDGPALLICLLSRLWDWYYRRSPQKSQIIQRAIILKPWWWSWWLWWKAVAWSCFWPSCTLHSGSSWPWGVLHFNGSIENVNGFNNCYRERSLKCHNITYMHVTFWTFSSSKGEFWRPEIWLISKVHPRPNRNLKMLLLLSWRYF